ncbi:hypothetical protein M2454_002949 [Aequitasia blattaphilus]|uniref:Uncharacterized protein n=1 Tax=Aequitasia blattaphilus TaxID=2949332 RepID=A0ABT1ED46_9FIRM|nr:hypothetical protein [Aequitasia blattaphilus]MCP1103586.1 hypothetical protein [Aequitasia blattaphilus]MCR8616226.1 hypothetical protein [Aequitasia blattaphilus]
MITKERLWEYYINSPECIEYDGAADYSISEVDKIAYIDKFGTEAYLVMESVVYSVASKAAESGFKACYDLCVK